LVLTSKQKKELIDKFKLHESDTGSPEVQVGLLTHRISYLTEHLKNPQKRPSYPQGAFDAGGPTATTAQLR